MTEFEPGIVVDVSIYEVTIVCYTKSPSTGACDGDGELNNAFRHKNSSKGDWDAENWDEEDLDEDTKE